MSDTAISTRKQDLEDKIRHTIPMSNYMQFSIESLNALSITTSAPLDPNINIHGSAFAGSLYTLATLTAWAFGQSLIERHDLEAELVMAKAEIRYRKPVRKELTCSCNATPIQTERFINTLAKGERARLLLEVTVDESIAAVIEATMIATPAHSQSRS